MDYELNLDLKELKRRTSKVRFYGIKLLDVSSRPVQSLSENDILALRHLTRACAKFDRISMRLDNPHNLEFLKYLDLEIQKGNERARLTKILFLAQKGIFSPDSLGETVALAKGIENLPQKGFYPEDLSKDEFFEILNAMLDENKIEELTKVLSGRSVVVRDGKSLKGIDYVDFFPELKEVAEELRLASNYVEENDFKKYLILQAKALETADPMLDAEADKVWATLTNTKFEFTITRECYDDEFTSLIFENKELLKRLEEKQVKIYHKDSLGCRVGLINKRGTAFLNSLSGMTEFMRSVLPYKSEKSDEEKISQTAVDVDLVLMSGEEGAYRAGIVLAQNLPNDDKLSLKIGGGRRNVYHRQVRKKMNKKLFKNLISKEFFPHFTARGDMLGTICHENTHSLGPDGDGLGRYSGILEEFKADMGMYAFLDELVSASFLTQKDSEEIIVTNLSSSFLKAKPSLSETHKTRSVMIVQRMIHEKAITFDGEGKLLFDYNKVKKASKQMINEVISIQASNDEQKAKSYVEKWFVWSDELERISAVIKKYSKKLNGYLSCPLADILVSDDFSLNKVKCKK